MGRKSDTPLSAGTTYFLPSRWKVAARGFVTDEEKQRFTVRQGARGRKGLKPSIAPCNVRARNELLDRGILIKKENYLELSQDHEFNSPSQAASVLLGRNASGPQEWKEWEEETSLKGNSIKRHIQQVADADDAPLRQFEKETRTWPQKTEADQLVRRRRGQDILREHLMKRWRCCCLTGISDQDLLRASHIVPWAQCQSDAARLDVHNGLLLSALWDAAFDRGLVTFDDGGYPQFSPRLSQAAQAELRWREPISLTPGHQNHLAWHRQHVFGSK